MPNFLHCFVYRSIRCVCRNTFALCMLVNLREENFHFLCCLRTSLHVRLNIWRERHQEYLLILSKMDTKQVFEKLLLLHLKIADVSY